MPLSGSLEGGLAAGQPEDRTSGYLAVGLHHFDSILGLRWIWHPELAPGWSLELSIRYF